MADHPILLFDGVCNLCNGIVNFVIDRDPKAAVRFAALQSDAGRMALRRLGLPDDALETFILIEDGHGWMRSTAALRVARRLGAPWSWTYPLIFIPRGLRDWLYNVVARRRYRWFGKRAECRVPTPELKARFLE